MSNYDYRKPLLRPCGKGVEYGLLDKQRPLWDSDLKLSLNLSGAAGTTSLRFVG